MGKKGIKHLHHITQDYKIINFQHLIQMFSIWNNQYLQYLQLKSTILPKLKNISGDEVQDFIIKDFLNIPGPHKLLSKIYSTESSTSLPVTKWEQDLCISPNPDFWSQVSKNIFIHCKIPNLQLIQFKVMHRYHYMGDRLHKMGFTTSDQCTHCIQDTTDTCMHALWHCTLVK